MNKNRKRILAMALSLFSVGKNFNKDSQAMTVVENKKHMPIISSNFKKFMPYIKKYARYLKFAGGATGAFFATITVKSLLGKFEKTKKQIKIVVPSIPKISLQKIDNNPFAKVIPHYKWQNGNCFFLSSLYNLRGPENQWIYDLVAAQNVKFVENKVIEFCKNNRGYKYFINEPIPDGPPVAKQKWNEVTKNYEFDGHYTYEEALRVFKEERGKKVEGFIELCKLFSRQKNFTPNKDFDILPKNFKGSVMEFEEKLCGRKLLDRGLGGGSFDEVIDCFTSEESPFLLAFGDKSIFARFAVNINVKDAKQEKNLNYDQKIKFTLPTFLGKIEGEEEHCTQKDNDVEVGEDGKITVNGQNYYLVSISQTHAAGEGHIICVQPKYSIDEKNNISLSAALQLSCSPSADILYKCDKISDIIRFWGSVSERTDKNGNEFKCIEYCFRFAPESAIRQYQDYYCMKN